MLFMIIMCLRFPARPCNCQAINVVHANDIIILTISSSRHVCQCEDKLSRTLTETCPWYCISCPPFLPHRLGLKFRSGVGPLLPAHVSVDLDTRHYLQGDPTSLDVQCPGSHERND